MIRLFFILLVFNFLVSCQTMKEGFSLQKKQAADEFLVEKKNPLVQPPEYGELPTPTDSNIDKTKTSENEIEKLLGSDGGHAEYVVVNENLCSRIDENTDIKDRKSVV